MRVLGGTRVDRLGIDFVNNGRKTILESTELKQADPPKPDFKFPRANTSRNSRKVSAK